MRSIAIALAVARKDLLSEWRSRELVPALAQFVVLALVIANFGFQINSSNAPAIAPGVLWLALVFAGLVAFGRAFAAEKEQASLEQVIDHYARGGRKSPYQDSRIRPLALSQTERADLVAFLRSLTDREFVADPRFR